MSKEDELIKYLEGLSKDEIIGITIREFNENKYFREVKIGEYLKENQELKDRNKLLEKHYKQGEKNLGTQIDITLKYEKVLDEIREYIEEFVVYSDEDGEIYFKEEFWNEYNNLLQILDKVKE